MAEPIPAVCKVITLLKAEADTRLRVLPLAIAVSGDDLRPRVAQVFQNALGFQPGDIITKVNGGVASATFPELLKNLRGLNDEVIITVERRGVLVDVRSPLRIIQDPLKARAINLSGIIIAEPWRLDDFEVNPQQNLVVDWYESGEEAALTDVRVSDYIVSVDGRDFRRIDALYEYLEKLASNRVVEIMIKRASSSPQFFREYRLIKIGKNKLEWMTVN